MIQKLNKILLVDDNEADNYLYKLIIFEVEVVESVVDQFDGKLVLEYLEKGVDQQLFDFIFLDINMLCMNGWEFFEVYVWLFEEL